MYTYRKKKHFKARSSHLTAIIVGNMVSIYSKVGTHYWQNLFTSHTINSRVCVPIASFLHRMLKEIKMTKNAEYYQYDTKKHDLDIDGKTHC